MTVCCTFRRSQVTMATVTQTNTVVSTMSTSSTTGREFVHHRPRDPPCFQPTS